MKASKLLIAVSIILLAAVVVLSVILYTSYKDLKLLTENKFAGRYSKYCITNDPGVGFLKVKVELLGSNIKQKNFLMAGIDFAKEGCFDEAADALVMNNFVPLLINDSTILFKTRFHSLGKVNNAYKFSIKLLNSVDSVIAKFPKDKDYAEGKIPSLSTTIQIADFVLIPKQYRNVSNDSTILVQNF